MSEQQPGDPTGWYCVRDDVTWPGCGECLFCLHAAAFIFRAARRLRQENDRYEAGLAWIAEELRTEGL